jgi:cytoskeletal protein RodZ
MAKRKRPSDDENQENMENLNEADNFGLPDIEYKPLDAPQENPSQEEPENTYQEPVAQEQVPEEQPVQDPVREEYRPSYSYQKEETKSNASVIIAVVIGLVVVVAGFLIYQYVIKPQREKERQEQLAKAEADRKEKEEKARLALEQEAERKRREAEAAANAAPKEGAIETLTERTRRYYVVITSAVDGDLVMDYAKKLSAKGVSTKIIPPFGKYKFSRLAIADHDTFANAQANADAVKGDYGSEVWVIKY